MRSNNYLFYDFVKITAAIPGLIWLRPKVLYENEKARQKLKGGALVVSNHAGFLDPLYVMYAIPYRRLRFVCGIEFFESKARWFFKQFHCIPIDRNNFSMDSFREITSELNDKKLVGLFPEGHVNSDSGNLDSFKSGMIMMALKGNIPIVPIYIRNRKHITDRLVAMIGEPVSVCEENGTMPTFGQIAEMTLLLQKKEEELKERIEKIR